MNDKLDIVREYNRNGCFIEAKKLLLDMLVDEGNINYKYIMLEMGQTLLGMSKFTEAKEYFQNVLNLESVNVYAFKGILKCLLNMNKYTDLLTALMNNKLINKREKTKILEEVINNFFDNKALANQNINKEEKIIKENITFFKRAKRAEIAKKIITYYKENREANKEEEILKWSIRNNVRDKEIER